MGSQSQWEDAYCIAERMFNAQHPLKRTDLNILEQIICSKYKTVFEYDALTDEYSFINQELKFDKPVAPFCRNVAEVDLEELKKNTVKVNLEGPSYINITPICVVPPAAMLVFNYTQHIAEGLTESLQIAKSALTVNPMDSEVKPGGEFVFKHKDGKCYRCIVIAQVAEKGSETERRYEVAFLDHCQIVQVKLKTLFISADLGLDKYPCALHIVRPVGIASFRNVFVKEYNDLVRSFYVEKAKRKAGLMAILYKTHQEEMKLIIDFPSFHGNEFTNSEEIRMLHGHHAISETDPVPLSYEQLMNREILPLEYPETHDGEGENGDDKKEEASKVDNNAVAKDDDDDDDVELDLSDAEPTSVSQSIRLKEVAESECPFGRSSIEKFLQQHKAPEPKSSAKIETSEPSKTERPQSPKKTVQPPEQVHPNKNVEGSTSEQLNESMSSLRSGTINQTCSSTPTPQPTFDEILNEDVTPTKSDDGWGTPKISPQKLDNPVEIEAQKPLIKSLTSVPVVPIGESSLPVQSLQRPSSPTTQTVVENKTQNVGIPTTTQPVPLMSIKTQPVPLMNSKTQPPKFGFGSMSSQKENRGTSVNETVPLPVPETVKDGIDTSISDRPSDQKENRDRTLSSVFSEPNEDHPEKSQVDVPANSTEQLEPIKNETLTDDTSKQSDLEETMLDCAKDEERSRTTVCVPEHDADLSKASTNQCMIKNAQDNFHDSEDVFDVQDVQNAPETSAKVFEHVDSIVVAAANKASINDGHFSRNSLCSDDFRQSGRNSPELEVGADSATAVIIDELSNVSEEMKGLASSFIKDINDAAIQKNRSAYWMELSAMEVVSHKFSDGPDRRFWKSKIAEARKLEEVFD